MVTEKDPEDYYGEEYDFDIEVGFNAICRWLVGLIVFALSVWTAIVLGTLWALGVF